MRVLALLALMGTLGGCQHMAAGRVIDRAHAVSIARADADHRHLSLDGLVLVVTEDEQSWRVDFNYPVGTRRVGSDGYGWAVDKRSGAALLLPVTE